MFPHHGVVGFRELEDEIVRASQLGRMDDRFKGCARIREGNVLPDAPVEEHVLLQHHTDLTTQQAGIRKREVDTINQHAPSLRDIETLNQLGQRALARA